MSFGLTATAIGGGDGERGDDDEHAEPSDDSDGLVEMDCGEDSRLNVFGA